MPSSRLQDQPHVPFYRVTDAAFNFLLVWYYCTLTIRESILINNGSRWARVGAPPQLLGCRGVEGLS